MYCGIKEGNFLSEVNRQLLAIFTSPDPPEGRRESLTKCLQWRSLWKVKVLVAQSCPAPCNSMDCRPSGSSIHGILQARILEWVAISFSRGSSQPRDRTQVFCIGGGLFTVWAIKETPEESPADTKENPHYLLMWTDFFWTFYYRTPYLRWADFSRKNVKGLNKIWNWEMHCLQNLKIPKRCLACFKFMSTKRVNNCCLSVRMALVYLIIFRNLTGSLCTICRAIVLWVLLYLYVQSECVNVSSWKGKGCLHYNV